MRESSYGLLGFLVVDNEMASFRRQIVAEHAYGSDPLALTPRRLHLVPRPLPNDLPLELGKRKQNVEGQAAQRCRGIQLLGHGHEAHRVAVKSNLKPAGIA